MPPPCRKRPLLAADNVKPPPRTDTMLRIERLLDDNPKRKKKIKSSLRKKQETEPPTSTMPSHWSKITARTTSSDINPMGGRVTSVLAPRGGLSSAPGYRKASTQPRRIRKPVVDLTGPEPNDSQRIGASGSSKTERGIANKLHAKEVNENHTRTSIPAQPLLNDDIANFDDTAILHNKATTTMGLKLRTTKKPRENPIRHALHINAIDLTASDTEEDVVLRDPKKVAPIAPAIAEEETAETTKPELSVTRTQGVVAQKKRVSTADLLASTEATHKLLVSGTTTTVTAPKPAGAPSDVPPPAYQRHSDMVAAYLQEKERKKNGANHAPLDLSQGQQSLSHPPSKKVNDNFVRLNMRNSSGSCRGARSKKRNNKYQDRYGKKNGQYKKGTTNDEVSRGGHFYTSKRTGLDPLDDYADGVFHKSESPNAQKQRSKQVPKCARHQLPCKLIVVKKTSTGNKGRKFYACSMPRGEQW